MNFSLLLSRMQSSCNVSVRYGNANVCHKWCACEIACIALFAMFSCRSESTFIFMSSSFTSFLLQFSSFSRCLSLFLRSYRARSCRSPAFFLPILFALPLSLYARFFQPRETFSIYFPHPSPVGGAPILSRLNTYQMQLIFQHCICFWTTDFWSCVVDSFLWQLCEKGQKKYIGQVIRSNNKCSCLLQYKFLRKCCLIS